MFYDFRVCYHILEVIIIFQGYINIIYVAFPILDTNTNARYEYEYTNVHKYE